MNTPNKQAEPRIINIKSKEYGSPIINIKCAKCGEMFSEKSGHTCGDNNIW